MAFVKFAEASAFAERCNYAGRNEGRIPWTEKPFLPVDPLLDPASTLRSMSATARQRFLRF
jgi:hypothetical protein